MKTLFFSIIMLTTTYFTNAIYAQQQEFIKTINDNSYGTKVRVLPTSDGGWVLFSLDSLKLTKFNSCGTSTWSKKYSYSGSSNLYGLCDFIKINGGYALLTRMTIGDKYSSLITKLDESGNVIWSKIYEHSLYNHWPYTLNPDNQGNFILFANLQPVGGGDGYNMISKIQANGNVIWTKFYDHGGIWGGAIVTSDNGVLARTGDRFIKTNSVGNVEWTSQFSSPSSASYYFAPIEVSDGYIFSWDLGESYYKMDLQGNMLWSGTKSFNFTGTRALHKKNNGTLTYNIQIFIKLYNGRITLAYYKFIFSALHRTINQLQLKK